MRRDPGVAATNKISYESWYASTDYALRANVVKDNRLYIRYKNGLRLWISVNWDGEHWQTTDRGKTYDLPPGGWLARQDDDFIEFSAIIDGSRVDFVDSPEYVYLDRHGRPVEMKGYTTDRQWIRWKTGAKAGEELRFPAG